MTASKEATIGEESEDGAQVVRVTCVKARDMTRNMVNDVWWAHNPCLESRVMIVTVQCKLCSDCTCSNVTCDKGICLYSPSIASEVRFLASEKLVLEQGKRITVQSMLKIAKNSNFDSTSNR